MKKLAIIICCLFLYQGVFAAPIESRIFPNSKNEAQYYLASENFKWTPDKFAFRCGDVNSTYDVGLYSVAFGRNCKASGNYSFSWGWDCNSSGAYSTSWGDASRAIGIYSTAWGSGSLASGSKATAWGGGSLASGLYSTAWGGSIASGTSSTASGEQCLSSGTGSVSFGRLAKARATDSIAIGYDVNNVTEKCFAVGFNGIDFTVKENEINLYDCNVIGGQFGGDDVNYTEFEADGTMVMNGDATTWDDLRIIPSAFDKPSSAFPALVDYQPGGSGTTFKVYEFAKSDYAFFTCQLPHSYKVGSDVYCHIHWNAGTRGNEESGTKVDWKLDYSWASIGSVFPASTTIDINDTVTGTDHLHEITQDVIMDGHTVSKGISSILICKIYRDTTYDTWAGTSSGQLPILLEVDFHYEQDTIGSRTKSTK